MKIGLNGTFWGMETTGSGQYLHHLIQALASMAPETTYTLFLPRSVVPPRSTDAVQVVALATPFDRLDKNLAKLWFEQVAFPAACRRAGVDVVHVPYFAPPLCGNALRSGRRNAAVAPPAHRHRDRRAIPTIVTIHDLIPLILPDYRGSRWVRSYMRLASWAARGATLVLTDSRASARDIERLLGIPPSRIRVIYLAAESRYRPMTPAEGLPVLERLGVLGAAATWGHYLLYLGGFDRRKNVPGLLRAFALARSQCADVPLVIAGRLPQADTAFAPDPRAVAERLGLSEALYFTGWVAEEDKPALYAGALAFVFPSIYEGFGLPVLEAISCGTPTIVGSGSSLEEVAGPGGLAVPPGDDAALADALIRIVQDEPLRREMSRQGLAHAARFSWHATARQTLAAYGEALSCVRDQA